MRYVICYDTPSDKRRAKLAKKLESYGFRVQYSVFECELTRPLLREALRLISQTIDPEVDNVRVYPVCESCTANIRVVGIPDPYGIGDPFFAF